MSDEEIKSNLCYYDPKNPYYNLDAYDKEDRPQPRNECYCDNCFYGRDKLAMQLLELKRECDEARSQRNALAASLEYIASAGISARHCEDEAKKILALVFEKEALK